MNDIKLELLASLPAFELGVEGSYLAALGRIVGASPTAINPSERAELLQWLVNGLQKDVWSEPGASECFFRALARCKALR